MCTNRESNFLERYETLETGVKRDQQPLARRATYNFKEAVAAINEFEQCHND